LEEKLNPTAMTENGEKRPLGKKLKTLSIRGRKKGQKKQL